MNANDWEVVKMDLQAHDCYTALAALARRKSDSDRWHSAVQRLEKQRDAHESVVMAEHEKQATEIARLKAEVERQGEALEFQLRFVREQMPKPDLPALAVFSEFATAETCLMSALGLAAHTPTVEGRLTRVEAMDRAAGILHRAEAERDAIAEQEATVEGRASGEQGTAEEDIERYIASQTDDEGRLLNPGFKWNASGGTGDAGETVVDTVARALCQIEMRHGCATLERVLSEVDRTWRRYRPEAEELLAEIAALGGKEQ